MDDRRSFSWNWNNSWIFYLFDHRALFETEKRITRMKFFDLIHEVNFEKLVIEGTSPFHRLDPRIKVIGTLALVFGIVAMNNPEVPLFIFFACVIISLAIGIPAMVYLRRLLYPLLIAIVVFIIVTLTYTGDGISFAFLLFTRIIAAVSVLNIFVATTSVTDAMNAMRWLKVPKIKIDLTAMMFRYIHLLSKESMRMHHALSSRCGFSNKLSYKDKIKNLGIIAGSLILRAFNRGNRVYMSMISRGYDFDSSIIGRCKPLSKKDMFFCALAISGVITLVIGDRLLMGAL